MGVLAIGEGESLTFEALLEQVRPARAMSLLANREMSVERITEEIGYRGIRSVRRAFKCWTGLSPTTFGSEGSGGLPEQALSIAEK